MTRLIRTELLKLTTTRLFAGLLAAAGALTALAAVLTAARAGSGGHMEIAPLSTASGLHDVLTRTGFALILAMVFGVTVSSGEFRHVTATATYLASPNRSRVLAAKSVSAAVAGTLFGALAAAVTTATGLAFVAARGYPVAISGATIARYGVGAALAAGLLAAAGVAVGSLIRSQLAAIVTVFAFGFVVEEIIGGLFPSIAPYLPFTAATTLGGAALHGGATPLPFAAAAGLVLAVAAVLAAVADRTVVRADIT